jgi:hypothetical protein
MDKVLSQKVRLKRIAELMPFEVDVVDKYKTGHPKRIYWKLCYKKAWDYVRGRDDVILCHGLYTEYQVAHAWVELPGNIVFDGVMQRFYIKEGYYKTLKITKLVEYTSFKASRLILEYRHFGPWHSDHGGQKDIQ